MFYAEPSRTACPRRQLNPQQPNPHCFGEMRSLLRTGSPSGRQGRGSLIHAVADDFFFSCLHEIPSSFSLKLIMIIAVIAVKIVLANF